MFVIARWHRNQRKSISIVHLPCFICFLLDFWYDLFSGHRVTWSSWSVRGCALKYGAKANYVVAWNCVISFRCQETSCYYTTMQDMQLSQSCLLFQLLLLPVSAVSIPMWCLWGPTGASMLGHTTSPIRTSSSGKQRKLRFWSSTTCAEATQFNCYNTFWFRDDDPQCPIFSMAKLSHQSTRSTSPVVSLSLELVQLVELPRRLLAQQRQLDAGASGRVWRTRAPRRYRPFSRDGHWVWISGANFCMLGSRLVLSQICVHRTKTTLLIQHSKYEQIYDCAVAIRRPIQGMTHSVPTISGSTVFAREQATAAQVLTMGRRIGTRAWNQTMGPIAERKKWREADAKL